MKFKFPLVLMLLSGSLLCACQNESTSTEETTYFNASNLVLNEEYYIFVSNYRLTIPYVGNQNFIYFSSDLIFYFTFTYAGYDAVTGMAYSKEHYKVEAKLYKKVEDDIYVGSTFLNNDYVLYSEYKKTVSDIQNEYLEKKASNKINSNGYRHTFIIPYRGVLNWKTTKPQQSFTLEYAHSQGIID